MNWEQDKFVDQDNPVPYQLPEIERPIDGTWVKYSADDPNMARYLSLSLVGYNTGWCLDNEASAAQRLETGEVFVYYIEDETKSDTIPRIAIWMKDGEVSNLEGTQWCGNLEGEMTGIAASKLAELPGGEGYRQKIEDMKRLTELDKRLRNNPEVELSQEDARFLYQLDRYMEYFGHAPDYRVRELVASRDVARDLNPIFAETPVWEGDLVLHDLYEADVNGLKLPREVKGTVKLFGVKDGTGVTMPEEIEGDLLLPDLVRAGGLKIPVTHGSVLLCGLRRATGLKVGPRIGRDLDISEVRAWSGLPKFRYVGGDVDASRLGVAFGASLLKRVRGNIYQHPHFRGTKLARHIGGQILATSEYGLYD